MTEILVISHKYPPTVGGMERHCFELVKHLSSHYVVHQVIYTPEEGNKLLWMARLKAKVKNKLTAHPQTALIYLNDGLIAAVCRWLPAVTDIPVAATYHGLDITFPAAYFQQKIIPQLHRLDLGIAVSTATRAACLERGFAAEKVLTVVNGVDHDIAEIPYDRAALRTLAAKQGVDITGKKILVTMGRAVPRKGFSWFLEKVMPYLAEDVLLLMIGPLNKEVSTGTMFKKLLPEKVQNMLNLFLGYPADEEAVVRLLSHEKLKGRVVHLGKLPFKTMMQVLSAADLFVMPNISVPGDAEGFGLVALEASLRGTLVMASGIEGITSAVHDGKNGILMPSAAPQEWIARIQGVLSSPEALAVFSDEGLQYSKQTFSWEKMAKRYKEAFQPLIDTYMASKVDTVAAV